MFDSTQVKPTLQVGVDPLLFFVKKIPMIESICEIHLGYIVRFEVHMSC